VARRVISVCSGPLLGLTGDETDGRERDGSRGDLGAEDGRGGAHEGSESSDHLGVCLWVDVGVQDTRVSLVSSLAKYATFEFQ
jgi:hypothetical protein